MIENIPERYWKWNQFNLIELPKMDQKSKLDLNEQDIKKLIIQKMFKDESSLGF